MIAHFFRMVFEMPDGPGALCGFIFVRVFAMQSGVKIGNLDWVALGGFLSLNGCSSLLRGCLGGKNVLARHFAFESFEVAVVPSSVFRSGMRCLP